MILLLDTSTKECKIYIYENNNYIEHIWQADRDLAKELFEYLKSYLKENNYSLDDISGMGVFLGPGSFTGLRIGMTVVNTIADINKIPIVGANGENWKESAIKRLENGENDKIVIPNYGSDANISLPKK